ncbi:hypothetical protein [Modestobacter roseus]|uniref:Uncharacterized protein n=1 Tax=Modestobacter roseus TaxID=1181884 RepID=A0A562ILI8_9ACTN|nr:hypothetical protein [Modestobacter roseus]MQA32201.1 hypothetical protein [Modestobacter roseus]TWH71696.1 hypothetical protein JD78_00194 [Modestobacter roseus]
MSALRLLGWAVAAVVVPGWLALVEVLWLPWRPGGVPVPISIVVAVVGNVLLGRAARELSGSRLVGVLPALAWLAVVLAAASPRPEGDLLLPGGDAVTTAVNMAFLLLGVVSAAFAVGQAIGGPRRPALSPGAAGSGSGGAR